jgi:hypothetical protein
MRDATRSRSYALMVHGRNEGVDVERRRLPGRDVGGAVPGLRRLMVDSWP